MLSFESVFARLAEGKLNFQLVSQTLSRDAQIMLNFVSHMGLVYLFFKKGSCFHVFVNFNAP